MDGKCPKYIRSLLPCVIIGFFSSSNMTGVGSADSDKDSTIPRSTKEIIRDFGNYTTTHGVGRLAEAKTIFSRLIWTIFILGAFLYVHLSNTRIVSIVSESTCIYIGSSQICNGELSLVKPYNPTIIICAILLLLCVTWCNLSGIVQ